MSELSIPSTVPLRERLPAYAAHLKKLEAKRERAIGIRIRRELGLIATLSSHAGPISSELTIVSYEPSGRHGSVRTERLAWDLGAETDLGSADDYIPHLYLAENSRRFYRGDSGRALPDTPIPSFNLLRRVRDVRVELEQQ